MILTGVVGVSAANTLTSNGVLYSNAGSSVTTVEGALNELYANYNSLLAKGNASASDILSGKTALLKGKEVTGTMANYSNKSIWINGDNGTFYNNINHTYSNGSTTNEMVVFKSNKTGYFDTNTTWLFGKKSELASLIKAGSTLLGVTGTYTSDANAAAENILKDKNISNLNKQKVS